MSAQKDATELLPCPWCEPLKAELIGTPKIMGYGNVNKNDGKTNWHGVCVVCGAEGPKEATIDAARAAWNRRPDQSLRAAQPADRDAMESARQIVAAADDVASSQGEERRKAYKRLGVVMANEYGIIRMARALSIATGKKT